MRLDASRSSWSHRPSRQIRGQRAEFRRCSRMIANQRHASLRDLERTAPRSRIMPFQKAQPIQTKAAATHSRGIQCNMSYASPFLMAARRHVTVPFGLIRFREPLQSGRQPFSRILWKPLRDSRPLKLAMKIGREKHGSSQYRRPDSTCAAALTLERRPYLCLNAVKRAKTARWVGLPYATNLRRANLHVFNWFATRPRINLRSIRDDWIGDVSCETAGFSTCTQTRTHYVSWMKLFTNKEKRELFEIRICVR